MEKRRQTPTRDTASVHYVAAHGFVEELRTLIDQRADVNALDEDGFSPVFYAASQSRVPKILQTLVDAKADPNVASRDATGTSPAAWAELLEQRRAPSTSGHKHILSPLTWATLKKSAAKLKILIDAKADVNFMNVPRDKSSTALFLAVEMGSLDIVKLLVEAQAALDVLNHEAYTVLDVAERNGYDDIAQLLLDANAPRGVWWRMQQACINGHAEEVKLLLDAGYLLHLQDSYSHMPLVLAVQHDRADIAQMLIAAGAQVNVPDNSLLLMSIKRNNVILVLSLVAAHADVNVCDDAHCPITYSILRGDIELTKLLIDARANVDLAPLSCHKTALRLAVERRDLNAARLLVGAKANINHLVDNGTPLACAAASGQLEMMELLLEAKASVDAQNGPAPQRAPRDNSTASPLLMAILGGHAHILHMLVAAKAALVSRPDVDDPLTVAAGSGNTDIMKILIDAKAPLEAAAGKSSPLRVAMDNLKLPAMQLLLEAKAATDIPGTDYADNLWSRALDICMRSQNDNVLSLLLDANPSLASNRDSTKFIGPLYKQRRFSTLQLLLENHASVDGVTGEGNLPILHRAVLDRMPQIVKQIIDTKADLNILGPHLNDTPLIAACRRGYPDIVELLLEAKATLDAKDCKGRTALNHAAKELCGPSVEGSILKMLVDAKAPVEYSALKYAVDGRQSAVVKLLVDAKANLRVGKGVPIFMRALTAQSASVIDTLLTADPSLYDDCDSDGMTPLMFAIIKYDAPHDARNVRMLLEHAWAHCAAESGNEPPAKRFKRTE